MSSDREASSFHTRRFTKLDKSANSGREADVSHSRDDSEIVGSIRQTDMLLRNTSHIFPEESYRFSNLETNNNERNTNVGYKAPKIDIRISHDIPERRSIAESGRDGGYVK